MSEGKHQILQIQPARELVFQGPFTDVVNAHMTLKNPTSNPVCFKVKTTAPKQYCVRPNSGLIKSGDEKTVTVMLQPMDGIPSDANRHKFMVQSCVSPHEDVADLEAIWKIIEPSELMYSKLMVSFVDNKRGDSTNASGNDESHIGVAHTSDLGSTPTGGHEDAGTMASLRKSLKTAIDDKEALQAKFDSVTNELFDVRKINRKLQQQGVSGGVMEGYPTLQVVLFAIATLLIGLILGKAF